MSMHSIEKVSTTVVGLLHFSWAAVEDVSFHSYLFIEFESG